MSSAELSVVRNSQASSAWGSVAAVLGRKFYASKTITFEELAKDTELIALRPDISASKIKGCIERNGWGLIDRRHRWREFRAKGVPVKCPTSKLAKSRRKNKSKSKSVFVGDADQRADAVLVAKARNGLGLGQRAVAAAIPGINDFKQLSDIERSRALPRPGVMEALFRFLGVDRDPASSTSPPAGASTQKKQEQLDLPVEEATVGGQIELSSNCGSTEIKQKLTPSQFKTILDVVWAVLVPQGSSQAGHPPKDKRRGKK